MQMKFYERVVDGKPVDYFYFDFENGTTIVDKPAGDDEKALYAAQWAHYQAQKQAPAVGAGDESAEDPAHIAAAAKLGSLASDGEPHSVDGAEGAQPPAPQS